MRNLGFYLHLRMHTMLATFLGYHLWEVDMHWQRLPGSLIAESRLIRLAGVAAAMLVWIAFAGWCWIQFAERLLELPGLGRAAMEWTSELLTPDSIARRAMIRSIRG